MFYFLYRYKPSVEFKVLLEMYLSYITAFDIYREVHEMHEGSGQPAPSVAGDVDWVAVGGGGGGADNFALPPISRAKNSSNNSLTKKSDKLAPKLPKLK